VNRLYKNSSVFAILLWHNVIGCAVFDTVSPKDFRDNSSDSKSGFVVDGSRGDASVASDAASEANALIVFDAARLDSQLDSDTVPDMGDAIAPVLDTGLSDGKLLDRPVDVMVGDHLTTVDSETTLDTGVAQDATAEAATPDAAVTEAEVPSCGGTRVFDRCWYLAPSNVSCNQHCTNHGGYNNETESYVGTPSQGGSLENCSAVLNALGRPSQVAEGTRDDIGFGCHLWQGADPWWLSSPNFDPSAAADVVSIVCACRN
jgi:hypothetical protein